MGMMVQGRWRGVLAAVVVTGCAMSALAAQGAKAPPAAPAGDKVKGAEIFKAQKCTICHKIGGLGGTLGPELTLVGGRRDKAWFKKYLVNPKITDPKNKMPAVAVKGPDLDHLIAYLVSLK